MRKGRFDARRRLKDETYRFHNNMFPNDRPNYVVANGRAYMSEPSITSERDYATMSSVVLRNPHALAATLFFSFGIRGGSS